MSFIQAVHGLSCLPASGIVPRIISFSRQLLCFLTVWPQYASFLALTVSNNSLCTPALLRTYSFIFFAVHETHRIFLSPFISKASRRVSSFFLSVQLSQPYVTTGHTTAFISPIFVEIGMLWLFHIFCSDAPITCPQILGIDQKLWACRSLMTTNGMRQHTLLSVLNKRTQSSRRHHLTFSRATLFISVFSMYMYLVRLM